MAKSEQKNDAESGSTKKKSKLVLILILALTATTAVAGFLAWQHFSAGASAGAGAEGAAAEAEGHGEEAAAEDAGHGGSAEGQGSPTDNAIINFEPFLVNLADTEAFRYLRVTIRLAVTNKAKAESIAATEVMMSRTRDAILDILSSKTSSEIISTQGKENLKTEIKERLNSFLTGGPVLDVFFTDFVVQL